MLQGIWVPVVTPFRNDRIDWGIFEEHIKSLMTIGIQGIVIAGSTGEGIKLTEHEIQEIVSFSSRILENSGEKIIVGLAPASLYQAKNQIEKLHRFSIHAFLVLTPFYYPPSESQNELVDFYLNLAEFSNIPIILYNMPKYTHFEMNPRVISGVSHHPNIAGIKYSGSSLELLLQFQKKAAEEFEIISGNGTVFPEFFREGGESAILAIANILPRECLDIFNKRTHLNSIQETVDFVKQTNSLIVGKYGVAGIKLILSKKYQTHIELRSPYALLDQTAEEELMRWYSENLDKIL